MKDKKFRIENRKTQQKTPQQQKKTKVCNKGKRSKNLWIVKPGENSNRGNGIMVCEKLE